LALLRGGSACWPLALLTLSGGPGLPLAAGSALALLALGTLALLAGGTLGVGAALLTCLPGLTGLACLAALLAALLAGAWGAAGGAGTLAGRDDAHGVLVTQRGLAGDHDVLASLESVLHLDAPVVGQP
jgi:hypothetical protein